MGNLITTTSNKTDVGTQWREKAQEYNNKRISCIEKSQLAYQNGNHKMAKEWSEKAKDLSKKRDESNQKAAKAIFDALNNTKEEGKDQHPPRTYDFHGLYVKEAVEKLEEIMKYAQRQKWSDVTIIVGRGNHLLDGIPKVCECGVL